MSTLAIAPIADAASARTAEENTIKTQAAKEPFDRDDADLVVRSSDNVDFLVHRLILSMASSMFSSMLSLPQPPGTDSEKPRVDVLEDSTILDVFFRVLYPIPDPEMSSLSSIHQVLAAGMKYDAPAVVASMRRALSQPRIMEDNPLRVFAIACYYGMEEETRAAAEKAVINNRVVGRICAELNDIPAGPYYRLLKLNATRKTNKSKSSGLNRVTVDFTDIGPFCEPTKGVSAPGARRPVVSIEAPFDSSDADVILRSCDSVDFRVHRPIISLASPIMLQKALNTTNETDPASGAQIPVHIMDEDSVVVDALLRMCYPVAHPQLTDLELLLDVLSASRKYELKKAEEIVRAFWPTIVASDPLRLYLAAARHGWAAEAQLCADELLRKHNIPAITALYHPDMERTSNRWYRHLLFYLDELSKAATGARTAHFLSIRSTDDGMPCSIHDKTNECASRYPASVITVMPPSWLVPHFAKISAALKEKPHGSVLGTNSAVAKAFLTAVVADIPPCHYQKQGPPLAGKALTSAWSTPSGGKCTASDTMSWACTLLQKYAEKVDEAVQKVPFNLPTTSTS
ncbi:hypothetical protein C2E23DRAFT_903429 [Lenzites betulinus]|nr:hypothetical protein C2E23DRAFT_903429 [Lenzites betulinus]